MVETSHICEDIWNQFCFLCSQDLKTGNNFVSDINRLRTFDSGVAVLQSQSQNEDEIVNTTTALVCPAMVFYMRAMVTSADQV